MIGMAHDRTTYDEGGRCLSCGHAGHPRFLTHRNAAMFAGENQKSLHTWISRQNVRIEEVR
jgi:hypothetical protein